MFFMRAHVLSAFAWQYIHQFAELIIKLMTVNAKLIVLMLKLPIMELVGYAEIALILMHLFVGLMKELLTTGVLPNAKM